MEENKQYEYVISKKGTVKLTKYIGEDAEVTIPEEIDGYPVLDYAADCFKGNSIIKTINWMKRIVNIKNESFKDCVNLETINLYDGLEKIGSKSFRNCKKLKHICIPSSVTFIGIDAFTSSEKYAEIYYKTTVSLQSITGKSGSEAEEYARYYKIIFIDIDKKNEEKSSIVEYHIVDDGISIDKLLSYDNDIYIPDQYKDLDVVEIDEDCYFDSIRTLVADIILTQSIENTTIHIGKNIKRINCDIDLQNNILDLRKNNNFIVENNVLYNVNEKRT